MRKKHMKVPLVFAGILLLLILLPVSRGRGEKTGDLPMYKDPNLPAEERVEDLLARMTLEEKIDQLSGTGFDTKENTRLGIPVLRMADGPVGVRWGLASAFPGCGGHCRLLEYKTDRKNRRCHC